MGIRGSRRTSLALMLVAGLTVVAYQLVVDLVPGGATASDMILVVVSASATLAAAATARASRGRLRRFWTLATVSYGAWALGQAAWSLDRHLRGEIPEGDSVAYVGFGVATLMMPFVLMGWPTVASRGARLRAALDGLAVASALAFLAWRPLLAPVLAEADGQGGAAAGSLAIPAWHLITLSVCLLVLARGEGAARRVIGPLAAGNALLVAAGLLVGLWQGVGSERAGNGADGAVFVGTVLLLVAARAGRRESRALDVEGDHELAPDLPTALAQTLPLLPVAAALVTAVAQQIWAGGLHPGQVWAGLLLIAAVAQRQLVAVRDATRLAERVRAQAWEDPLTGLGNRPQLTQRLRRAIARARVDGSEVGVLLLDLDGFKEINDSQGHHVGDELLRAIADRLRGCLRHEDFAARLGGDEFVVLVEHLSPEAVEALAVRVLAALRAPVALPGTTARVAASLGIALGDGESTGEELLADADLAMYTAKRAGRNRFQWYSPQQRVALEARVRLEHDLKRAVDSGEFVAHFQPMIDLAHERIVGAEALVRWQHPDRGLVPPGEFLPAAEELGLMPRIGHSVLAQALHAAARWNREGDELMTVSVNLSSSQLADPELQPFLLAALEASGCPPGAVVVELTETLVLEDLEDAASAMAGLKALGMRIALDDFGTGYSGLNYLRALPIDILKIDKAFIDELGTEHDSGLSAAVIQLASSLELTPVAEGIETSAQVSALTALTCPLGQGFFYARPLPEDAFRTLLGTRRTVAPAAALR